MSVRLEQLMLQLGSPGFFQILVIALITYQYVFFIGFLSGLSFWPIVPNNYCQEADSSFANFSRNSNSCMHTLSDSVHTMCNLTQQKHKINEVEFYSVALEFELVCEKKYGIRLLQTLFFCGTMVGGIVFGPLADRYGRKPVLCLTVTSAAVLGIIISFVHNLYAFTVLKVMQGILLQGYNSTANCIKPEILQGKYRPKYMAFADALSLSLPMFYLASTAYLTANWRLLELITSVLLLLTVFSFWFMPETIRWLLKDKRKDEAMLVIKRITRFNKLPLPASLSEELDCIIEEINMEDEQQKKYDFRDLFRTSRIAVYSCVFGFSWFTWMFVSYGFQFSMIDLTGNLFVNFAFLGLGDLVFRSFAYLLLLRWESKQVSCAGMCTCGALLLIMVLLRSVAGFDSAVLGIMSTFLGLLGRVFLGFFVVSTYILLSEVYPTPIRVTAYGCFMALGRVGSLLASQALALGDYTSSEIPFLIFGGCAFLSGILNLLLPSTRHQPMPNNIQDTLKLHSKRRLINNVKV